SVSSGSGLGYRTVNDIPWSQGYAGGNPWQLVVDAMGWNSTMANYLDLVNALRDYWNAQQTTAGNVDWSFSFNDFLSPADRARILLWKTW
ncbi:MAG: hypothetical protein ACYCW6_27450, partial [Candidatus Xenobia bacterium]